MVVSNLTSMAGQSGYAAPPAMLLRTDKPNWRRSIVLFLVLILAPLTMFTPQMAQAKRKGLSEYGLLATRYVDGFEQKWVVGDAAEGDKLLGTGDIQSLADLGNSYAAVRDMRIVPFGLQDIGRLAAATAVPLLPLGLTVFSLEELVMRIFKILF